MVKEAKVNCASMVTVERVDSDGNSYSLEFPNSHPELRAGDLHVVDNHTGEVCAFCAKGAFVSFRHLKADEAA